MYIKKKHVKILKKYIKMLNLSEINNYKEHIYTISYTGCRHDIRDNIAWMRKI